MKYKSPLSIRMKTKKRTLLAFAIISLFTISGVLLNAKKAVLNIPQTITPIEGDYLVYVVSKYPEKNHFMFFEPAKNTHVPILSDWNISNAIINGNDRLAFSSSRDGNHEIYVLDYPFANEVPIKITDDTSTQHFPTAWSQDGQYLAYGSIQDNGTMLSIWDGKNSFQISDSPESIHDITWGPDGRLAFTIIYTYSHSNPAEGDDSEVFIWDGDKTVSLSQNPTGSDRDPAWNEDGKLAFFSERAGNYDIYVWDGVSTINGEPDKSTYTNIAASLTDYYSYPVWSNTGSLTFGAVGTGDTHTQIYEWDGKVAKNISQNADHHNGGQHWRNDGYWSFSTYFSGEDLVYIRDEKNNTQFISEGHGVRWSESGYFIFCHRTITGSYWSFSLREFPQIIKKYSGWTLSLGNGKKIIDIAQGDEIEAVWANGERVFCTSG